MFNWFWIACWTLIWLPLSIAFLRGWAPAWIRGRSSRRSIQARGVAGLLLFTSALIPAVLGLGGVSHDDFLLLRLAGGPILILCALALLIGSAVANRRDR
ncbi:hypothetical protein [Streptomyces shenzhenensis]|uniref:hypothetical protein n=1 Tax=Streptomyces shenzhenensis TaxID=943815 RepID=UPI00340FAD1F